MRHYTAVIYATGAQTDKSLGIAGEDLPGSWAATESVAWYNGHPDYRDLRFDLSARRGVVIGNGNVAADVIRLLTLSPRELERTDVADHALEALRESVVEEVVVLGRRGPAQAAFTSAELRELGRLDGVDLRVRADELELDRVSQDWLAGEGTFTARTTCELLREFAARPPRAGARRRIELRFLRSPVRDPRERHGSRRWTSGATRSSRADDGSLRARAVDEPTETIDVRARPALGRLPGRAAARRALRRARASCCPTSAAGCSTPDGAPLPGVYAVGWIERGPTGILGTNKRDAEETVTCLADDLAAAALAPPANPGREQIDALLAERAPDLVTSTAGAPSSASNASAAARASARASSSRRATSC